MKIVESAVRMSSSHEAEYQREVERAGSLSFRSLLADVQANHAESGSSRHQRLAKMLESLVDAILAAMEGKKCRQETPDVASLSAADRQIPVRGRPQRELTWAITATERIHDYEKTSVEGCGTVRTDDGRCIDFSLSAEFRREFSCEREYQESGKVVLMDPIVLNFDGKAAELTEERLAFDLDTDGKGEWLAGLGTGSAYLVLDRNGNGRIDDGSELFGAVSGDGFADMAGLDDDGNSWLDEGDAAFARLGLWSGRSGDAAQSLAAREVGAIWLGSVNSPFALKGDANELLGEIRAAGLYLREDGEVGMVQQVDLAIAAPAEEGVERPHA